MPHDLALAHRHVERIADEMEAIVREPHPGDLSALSSLRWRLLKELLRHLALEDRIAMTPLTGDPRPGVAALAAEHRQRRDELHAQLHRHFESWSGYVDDPKWETYRAAVLSLLEAVRRQMRSEEDEVFPLMARRSFDAAKARRSA